MAGYSGTPLPKKLGIKEGLVVGTIGSPIDFYQLLGDHLPEGVEVHQEIKPSDIFILFAKWQTEMEDAFENAQKRIAADGAIWVAWPKRSSGVETDLTEDVMRELFLPTGMVDNKVCAIDETWSGLRFAVRKENRPDWSGPVQI